MLGQKCLLPLMLTQAVIYSMYQIGKVVALQHITGPVTTPCCAGKPKKSILERLCGLKHADMSELVKLRQLCSKQLVGRARVNTAAANLSTVWLDNMHDRDPFHSDPRDSEHLKSCLGRIDALPSTLSSEPPVQ